MKRVFLFFALIGLSVGAKAQDTIRFTWVAGTEEKSFPIQVTNGEAFTIDWGDSIVESDKVGQGVGVNITLSHIYDIGSYDVTLNTANGRFLFLGCSYNNVVSLDVRNNTELSGLNCSGNQITSLDLSGCTTFTSLYCVNNLLSNLYIGNCTTLRVLNCNNNHLPLSDLFVASEILKKNDMPVSYRLLGSQTLMSQNVLLGVPLFADQAVFGGKYTKYSVSKNGSTAPASDYIITNGTITFHVIGIYTITMTNDAIISDPSLPAEVTVELTVKSANTDASLVNLSVSEGSLSPVFHSDTLDYTVDVPHSISSITLTATANDTNASVSGDGVKMLNVGTNSFTITVTAKDGITTQNYTVTVNRASDVGIEQLRITNYALQVYPNPATNQLTIDNGQLTMDNIEIYSVMGQKLQSTIVNLQSKIAIDVSNLASGMYYLKINNQITKFVKE